MALSYCTKHEGISMQILLDASLPDFFARFGITWAASGSSPSRDATDWTSTANFPLGIPYTYTVQDPACVKAKLPAVAGAGKGYARLSC